MSIYLLPSLTLLFWVSFFLFFYASSFKVGLDSLDRQVKDVKRDKGRAEDSVTKPCRETARLRDMQCKQGKPEHRAGGCR